MNTSYIATYYDAASHTYGANVFLSDVTITIRYCDKNGQEKEVLWITRDTHFWQQTLRSELQYKNNNGQMEYLVFGDVEFIQAIKKLPTLIDPI